MLFFKHTWPQSPVGKSIRNLLFCGALLTGISFGSCHLLGQLLVEGLSYKSPHLKLVKQTYSANPALFHLVARDTLADSLSLAISRQETQFARLMMDTRTDLREVDLDSYFNPLVSAAFSSDKEMTLELIARGFKYLPSRSANLLRTSPLLAAAYVGSTEVTRVLIDAGYSFNESGYSGSRPFEIAIGGGHLKTAELLLSVELDESLQSFVDDHLKASIRKAAQSDIEYLSEKRRQVSEHAATNCLIERSTNTLIDCFVASVDEGRRKTPIFDIAYLAILRDLSVRESVLKIDNDWDFYLLSYSIEFLERSMKRKKITSVHFAAGKPRAVSELENRWAKIMAKPTLEIAKTRFYWALDDYENPKTRIRAPASIRRGFISREDWLKLKHRTKEFAQTHGFEYM